MMHLISTDLPDPDLPNTTRSSPLARVISNPSSTTWLPNAIDRSRIRITGASSVGMSLSIFILIFSVETQQVSDLHSDQVDQKDQHRGNDHGGIRRTSYAFCATT